MIYDEADKAIRDMNRRNLRAFARLKLAKWDEIGLIRQVTQTYDGSISMAERKYLEIATKAYIAALIEAKVSATVAKGMADDEIMSDWILDMLEEVDPVTLYAFLPESERKKQRLIEALAVTQNRNYEVDRALRYWTLQVGQFAINTVDRARLDAFKAVGIKKVQWHTEEDEKVCETCGPMDGQVYQIDKVPPKPHINCRCWLTCVMD